jgi:ribosomal protein S18 acetylase RimI-like enzyme
MTPAAGAVDVRRYVPADEEGVVALWSEVFDGDPPWNEPRAMLRRKLASDPTLVFVAVIGSRVIGAVLGGYDGVRGWVYHLAVLSTERRRGTATRLMHVLEAALTEVGCPKLNLQVRTTNESVIGFYRALGYEVEERASLGKRLEGAPVSGRVV